MKFLSFHHGQLSLVLVLSVIVSACNPEEYFPAEEFIHGGDSYCSVAQDKLTCQDLGDRCQAAYLDLEKDDQEPIFAACIANPDYTDPSASIDPTNPVDSVSPIDPPAFDAPVTPPSIKEAWSSQCANMKAKYLYVKKLVSKKKTTFISKVKICHSSDKGEHTIIIACPALKAHAKHHHGEDYLGACQQQ